MTIGEIVDSKAPQNFMQGIAPGRREELARALKALWTHDSTAIEGNTLTLGDTMFVLQYGLTVKGKPLKDHDDVVAHARGVDLIQRLTAKAAKPASVCCLLSSDLGGRTEDSRQKTEAEDKRQKTEAGG